MRKILAIAVPKKKVKPMEAEEVEVVETIAEDTVEEDQAVAETVEESVPVETPEETPVETIPEPPVATPIIGKPDGYVVVNGEVVPDHTVHNPGVNSKNF